MSDSQRINKIDLEIAELNEKVKTVKGTKTEVYARIVGYHRAVDDWNKGKREEYKNRIVFNLGGEDNDETRGNLKSSAGCI